MAADKNLVFQQNEIADRGARATYHFNGIASWGVAQGGEVKHVYA